MFKINDNLNPNCLNCNAPLAGEYCIHCGQKKIKPYRTFWYLVNEFLSNYFSFDSKFTKTIIPLIYRPGFLTNEYREGKRSTYIPPIRLYVFVSIVFFLIFFNIRNFNVASNIHVEGINFSNVSVDTADSNVADSLNGTDNQSIIAEIDSFVIGGNAYPKFNSLDELEVYLHSLSSGEKPGWLTLLLLRQSTKMATSDPNEISAEIFRQFLDNLPKVIFVLLPVFALIFKILYLRRNYFYEEHFIFSIHFHTFLFILFLLLIPVSYIWGSAWWLLMLLPSVYLFFAMKKVFAQANAKTFIKLLTVMLAYLFVLIVAFIFNMALSALTV